MPIFGTLGAPPYQINQRRKLRIISDLDSYMVFQFAILQILKLSLIFNGYLVLILSIAELSDLRQGRRILSIYVRKVFY